MESTWRKDINSIISEAKALIDEGINDLFLMTTADYLLVDFLNIAKHIKNILPKNIKFVANIGDFDYNTAIKLKEVRFTGCRAMNAHETIEMGLICGVNQLYAEVGANPRDNISNTEKSHGLTVKNIKKLFSDAEYEI